MHYEVDEFRKVHRIRRTETPFRELAELDDALKKLKRDLASLPPNRRLLFDLRSSPARNDVAFERRASPLLIAEIHRYRRVVFLVKSVVGAMQLKRVTAPVEIPKKIVLDDLSGALRFLARRVSMSFSLDDEEDDG